MYCHLSGWRFFCIIQFHFFFRANSITKNRLKISVSIEKIVILGLIMFKLQ